jgi:hypothetical protein
MFPNNVYVSFFWYPKFIMMSWKNFRIACNVQNKLKIRSPRKNNCPCLSMRNIFEPTLHCLNMWSVCQEILFLLYPRSPKGEGVYCFTSVRLSVLPSVQDIFRRNFLNNCWWQKSDIWSQASYRYTILWVAFLDPLDCYFLFADLVGLYTHWTYMHIFRHIFLSNYWWQKSDIWSQASYRYPIS